MELKRLKEIQSKESPSLADIVEIVAENILTTSKHSKDIKALLQDIKAQFDDFSDRLAALEAKQSGIFQIEIDENEDEGDEQPLTFEEEIALADDD